MFVYQLLDNILCDSWTFFFQYRNVFVSYGSQIEEVVKDFEGERVAGQGMST